MTYTVSKIAEKLNIPPSTIRYYDKKGLLPFVERSRGGIRQFSEEDLSRMENILLLRRFGLSVQETETFVRLEEQGASTLHERLSILEARKTALAEEIRLLSQTLSLLEETCSRFEHAPGP